MTSVFYLIAWNLFVAGLAGMAVWLLSRTPILRHRPALCHVCWLLVLLKLVTPPLVPVPVLPAMLAEARRETPALPRSVSVAAVGKESDGFAPVGHDAKTIAAKVADITIESSGRAAVDAKGSRSRVNAFRITRNWTWQQICTALLGASLSVSLAIGLAALRQFHQVRRLLRGSPIPPGRAAQLLREVSRLLAPRSAPKLLLVDAPLTPMLWVELGNSAIVLPRQLVDAIDDDQLRSILAHELAHFVRRDHWADWFAFLVTTLFWWNPVAWFARREMAAAAEACCDAMAVERLAGSRKSYADTLLKVVDFVTSTNPLRPTAGIAFGQSHSLRRRFEMLATPNVKSRVSRVGWLLLALASSMLFLLPARAQEDSAPPVSPLAAAGGNASADDQSAPAKPPDSGSAKSNQAPKYCVTGIVFEKETHQPIADANIKIFVDSEQVPDKRSLSGFSDADGRYRIEVPLGSFRVWFPRLKPGYWLEPADNTAALVTSPDKPIVTHDIGAKRGVAWPVQVAVEGGIPPGTDLMVSVTEVEDDATRRSWLNGAGVSFKKSPNQSLSALGANGAGAFTQCGDTGKLVISVAGRAVDNILTEFIVEPGFDVTKVKSIAPVADTDKVEMIDERGAKATIGIAKVTLQDGLPLLTFHLVRKSVLPAQEFVGRIMDAAGNPVAAVRVGSAIGSSTGASSVTESAAETDQEGRFALKLTMPKSKERAHLMLIITNDGYAGFDSRKIDFPKQPSAAIDVGQFTLQAGQAHSIRTVDENDKPLAGAVVEPGGDYAQRRQAIRTDAQGRGVLSNLPAGVVSVSARYGSLMHQSKIVVDDRPADGEETTLVLRELNPQQTQAKPFPDPPPVGAAAPELSVVAWTDGQTRKLSDYRGKVVVLKFWGVWCSACLNGLPAMKELEAKYASRSDIVFLGIHSAGTDISQVKKLQRLKDWKLVTGLDVGSDVVEGATARAFGAHGWPTTVIIDRQGKIAHNSNLEKWNALTVLQEQARTAKAMNLPPAKPGATFEDRVARTNAMNVFRNSELINHALERK